MLNTYARVTSQDRCEVSELRWSGLHNYTYRRKCSRVACFRKILPELGKRHFLCVLLLSREYSHVLYTQKIVGIFFQNRYLLGKKAKINPSRKYSRIRLYQRSPQCIGKAIQSQEVRSLPLYWRIVYRPQPPHTHTHSRVCVPWNPLFTVSLFIQYLLYSGSKVPYSPDGDPWGPKISNSNSIFTVIGDLGFPTLYYKQETE